MGTHPIFESDFDCLTEMADLGFFGVGSDSSDSEEEVAPEQETRATEEKKPKKESDLPPPEEILLVRQRSDFFNDNDQLGVNWNNDSLVKHCLWQSVLSNYAI